MSHPPHPSADEATLLAGLRLALQDARLTQADAPLQLLGDKGLAHHHVRLIGTGWLARLPKQSQMGLGAAANLAYEAACFERAGPSGHVPRLHGELPPSAALPRGGLLVEEIRGRTARLPQDLPAIAQALAAVHSLPLPGVAQRAPLMDAGDPLGAMRAEIEAQAAYLDAAAMAPGARALVDVVRANFAHLCKNAQRPPRRLIAFDGHPGNYLIRSDGRAVLVDLEKARYSHPPLDLAHATLYTSTTWDLETHAELTPAQVCHAYAVWQQHCIDGETMRAWFVPLRAAMWLWSITWCAKWRVLSPRAASSSADGEDWSQQHSSNALIEHVRNRVDCYLARPAIEHVVHELEVLRGTFETAAAPRRAAA
jgi:hypothetical protein